MKMTESYIWDKLKINLKGFHLTRHEDKVTLGIPDVSYGFSGVNGWIELKAYRLPNINSIPSFNKFKRTQKKWLTNRGVVAGNCWILIGFGKNIMLLSWEHIPLCGEADLKTLISHSSFWGNIKDIGRIKEILY